MSSSTETRTIVEQIVDTEQERTFWEVVRHHERPPYFFDNEGVGNRLARAARVVTDGRLTPNSDGSYTVEGSEGRTYRVAERCSCPQAQKGKSHWCYHHIAVVLYLEWQRRIRPAAPASLGTLRAGTLPLPPVTVDERLARTMEALGTMNDAAAAVRVGQGSEKAAMGPPHTPQEDCMPDDEYTLKPETYGAPGATLDASDVGGPPLGQAPTPVKIPREFTVQIKGRTHVLYTGLVVAARASGLMTLAADWTYNDAELSLAHAVCTFADGRRYEESGDATPGNVSKGISVHFRRVALTRAKARCLRDALGISECSVEELEDASVKHDVPDMSAAAARHRIWTLVQQQAPTMKTKEQVSQWILDHTGYQLIDVNFLEIVGALEGK